MKVVVSGSTGYIGGEVLNHCFNHPSITSVLILSRRELGSVAEHPKAKVIIVKDFTSYDEPTLNEVKTADAALWCIGTYQGDEKIDIEFPLTFINAIKSRPAGSKPFRYVQLGGAFTEPPPKEGEKPRTLWYFTSGRRVRGVTEAKVLETTKDVPQNEFDVYLVKPGAVLPKYAAGLQHYIWGQSVAVGISEVAATMVDLAVRGNDQKIFLNQALVKHGSQVQKGSA